MQRIWFQAALPLILALIATEALVARSGWIGLLREAIAR